MLSSKAIVLCVLKILQKYSDEEHMMTENDIKAKLLSEYDLHIEDKRTIYKAIEMLNDHYLGYEIAKFGKEEDVKHFYLLRDYEKDLDASEIQIISDAVCAFPFISDNQSKEICRKIQEQLNIYDRKIINNLSIFKPDVKTSNKDVSLNISLLDEAIMKKVKVHFDYYRYEIDKKLHKRREKRYTVNPYGMVYCNEHYYLACSICYGTEMSLYRIDLMKNVCLTEYKLDDIKKGVSYKEEVKKAVNGFLGEMSNITMKVEQSEIGHVIDKFGNNINVSPCDDKYCIVRVKASRIGFVFWAIQFLRYVEVLKPDDVRQDIIDMIKSNMYGV